MPLTWEIIEVLSLLGIATILFAVDKIPAELVAIALMLGLVLCGAIDTSHAFAGFGSETVVMIFGLLVLTSGLERTGVVEISGKYLIKFSRDNAHVLLLLVMITAAVLSAFMSNTAATAFFLPVVFGAAMRIGESPARYLLPLAFASILTSSVTLISTSSNLVINELLVKRDMSPMGFFELAPVGIPIAIVGILYMWFIGRRIIPEYPAAEDEDFGLRPWLSEALVLPESTLIGKTIAEAGLAEKLDLFIVRIIRDNRYVVPRASTEIMEGDSLLIEGAREEILKIKEMVGIDIKADAKLVNPDIDAEDLTLVEGIVMPRSYLIGRTLKGMRFAKRYDLQVLAIARAEQVVHSKLSQMRLRMGDMLLLQGTSAALKNFEADAGVSLLGKITEKSPTFRRAPFAIAIFVIALILGGLKVMPLSLAVVFGALAMFITRCIEPEEAYRNIEWKLLLLIGSMLAVGPAMEESGTAAYLARSIVGWVGDADPIWLLAAFFGLSVLLTQSMSNQGAAVVVVPVAIKTALELGLNPRAFVMMIAIAASCSYLTPLEPSCLLVYGPGRYRFADFFKVGIGLTFIIFLVAIFLVPLYWPLRG